MSTTTSTTNGLPIDRPNPNPIPGCPNCDGSGWDDMFGNVCVCERFARTNLNSRMGVALLPSDTPDRARPQGNGTGRGVGVTFDASERQINFLAKLWQERTSWGLDAELMGSVEHGLQSGLSKRAASQMIDALMAAKRPVRAGGLATVEPSSVRRNARAQACDRCGVTVEAGEGELSNNGRWIVTHLGECPATPAAIANRIAPLGVDLSGLERFTSRGLVRVAVPGGDTRLKLRIKFNRGTVYVDDAAEYGYGRHYGRQVVGGTYVGDVQDELAAIVADPAAAILAYSELVGACGICNRPLEAETSVEVGIGPVCRKKLGL